MWTNNKFFGSICGISLLLLAIQANAQDNVEGYSHVGRGSCQDQRGMQYSYLQRTIEFPNAETCGKQECERFANSEHYRGFEYSVAQRCTCLFDKDEAPAVPNDESDPKYVTRIDNGIGTVTDVSGTPGTYCYRFGKNAGVMMALKVWASKASRATSTKLSHSLRTLTTLWTIPLELWLMPGLLRGLVTA